MDRLIAATDGSARGNPTGAAAWAWWMGEHAWASDGWAQGSNNQAELEAVRRLLLATAHVADAGLTIIADSQYVINSLTVWHKGWVRRGWTNSKGAPVANRDIIEPTLALLAGRDVTFEWVRGHRDHPLNFHADRLATATSAAIRAGEGYATGPGFRLHR